MSKYIKDELHEYNEFEIVKTVYYVIDFDKVKTLEDIKSVLKIFSYSFTMSS